MSDNGMYFKIVRLQILMALSALLGLYCMFAGSLPFTMVPGAPPISGWWVRICGLTIVASFILSFITSYSGGRFIWVILLWLAGMGGIALVALVSLGARAR